MPPPPPEKKIKTSQQSQTRYASIQQKMKTKHTPGEESALDYYTWPDKYLCRQFRKIYRDYTYGTQRIFFTGYSIRKVMLIQIWLPHIHHLCKGTRYVAPSLWWQTEIQEIAELLLLRKCALQLHSDKPSPSNDVIISYWDYNQVWGKKKQKKSRV